MKEFYKNYYITLFVVFYDNYSNYIDIIISKYVADSYFENAIRYLNCFIYSLEIA